MSMEFPNQRPKPADQPHVFIPFSFVDREFTGKLAGALRRDRVSPRVDEVEMSAGVFLTTRISKSAMPVDIVVPIISVTSVKSAWVQRELEPVMTKDLNGRRVVVLPAKVDNCTLPAFLLSRPFVDFRGLGWNRAYEATKALIQGRSVVRQAVPPTPAVHPPPPRPSAPVVDEPAAGTKRVFLSYDYEHDGNYRDILVTWSKHPDLAHFSINDQPVNVPVDSEEAEPLKRMITAKIKAATAFLCIVGAKTGKNGWVEWEIKKADELGKRMIAVRVNRDCIVPEALSEIGATCALSFTFEGIRRAIDEAYGGFSPE